MRNPENSFKRALREGRRQIGLWAGLADPYVAELLANAGFDWLLFDAEHAPNDVRSVLAQLQAVAAYPVQPIVRPAQGDTASIKQYLDIGAQTLLVPMVESAEQAARIVAATRYPPEGIRGVGSALARAARWNRIDNYLHAASDDICVLVQVESVNALQNLDAIVSVDGVDGVFFGPADLSASMGKRGNPADPSVQEAIVGGVESVKRLGKAVGILASAPELAHKYLDLGALFVAVGVDTTLLLRAATQLATTFKDLSIRPSSNSGSGVY